MKTTPSPERTVHLLRVHLVGTEPAVWRRIELESDTTLDVLHDAILRAFPWTGARPHELRARGKRYGSRRERRERGLEEESKVKVRAVAPEVGAYLEYTYAIGDQPDADPARSWVHELVVEAISPPEVGATYPRAIDGEGAAPPEGVEGPAEWQDVLHAYRAPEGFDPEIMALLGPFFDPNVVPAQLGITPAARPGDVPEAPDELRLVLERFGPLLTRRVRTKVIELGDRAAPPLLELLALDPAELDAATGWAQLQAVRLVGELRLAPALPRLLELLVVADPGTTFRDAVLAAVLALGDGAVEALLRAHAEGEARDLQPLFASILANLGVNDERIYALLVAELADDPLHAAPALVHYGDPRAAAVLSTRLDRAIAEGARSNIIIGLSGALEALGVELTPAQVAATTALQQPAPDPSAAAEDAPAPSPAPRPKKPGRNDPCWCGSGTKYKKCHLAADGR